MSEVTRLLDAAAAGDRRAAGDLLPLVYDELRKLAAVRMTAESPAGVELVQFRIGEGPRDLARSCAGRSGLRAGRFSTTIAPARTSSAAP